MKVLHKYLITIMLLITFLSSCTTDNQTATYSFENNPNNNLVRPLLDQRGITAFAAYPVALEKAMEWDPDASLYEIPSTDVVSGNIGIITYGPYWFFIFGTETSPREFYVAVNNGEFVGSFQAQPILQSELPYTKKILTLDQYIDNDEVLTICADEGYLDIDTVIEDEYQVDYRLVNINNTAIWSVFLIGKDPFDPICNVNAKTGDIANDPYDGY